MTTEDIKKEYWKKYPNGTKLGLKLFINQVKAIVRIKRKRHIGMRVSMSEIAQTGMPLKLLKKQNGKTDGR